MARWWWGAALVPLFLFGAPAAAQHGPVQQRSYTYGGTELEITVLTESAGELHVMRGGHGRVEVLARPGSGVAAFGLGGRESQELRLTAVDADHINFVVVVPERVRVRVRLPDRLLAESVSNFQPLTRYAWQGRSMPRDPAMPSGAAAPIRRHEGRASLFESVRTPRELALAAPSPRVLTVRTGEARFRISADRPLEVEELGDAMRLVGGPNASGGDIVVELPLGTTDFTLRTAGGPLLRIEGGQLHLICKSAVDQRLDAQRRWLTFSAGVLLRGCASLPEARRAQ
ncbi:MAG: hypothetical protein ACRELD_07310 [Longimicrobiales bacterium]